MQNTFFIGYRKKSEQNNILQFLIPKQQHTFLCEKHQPIKANCPVTFRENHTANTIAEMPPHAGF